MNEEEEASKRIAELIFEQILVANKLADTLVEAMERDCTFLDEHPDVMIAILEYSLGRMKFFTEVRASIERRSPLVGPVEGLDQG